MNNLLHIEPFVDPALKELTKDSLKNLTAILIALRRIRGSWMNYFEDFIEFLKKKVETQDPDLFIYHKYTKFLNNNLEEDKDICASLFEYLEKREYGGKQGEKRLADIRPDFNENAFINRLPKTNAWFLWMCIFYLYKPRLSQKFFWGKLEYVLEDEADLLSNYRVLPENTQDKIIEYMKKLANEAHLNKLS